jgi:VWFA-related protein
MMMIAPRRKLVLAGLVVVASALPAMMAGQATTQTRTPVFRSNANLVRVDVVVRDRDGKVVKGLKDADFLVFEDGKPQTVTTFSFQEMTTENLPPLSEGTGVLSLAQLQSAAAQRTVAASATKAGTAASAVATAATGAAATAVAPPAKPVEKPVDDPTTPKDISAEELANRRIIVILFDTSSMQPDEIDRAVKSANEYIDKQMSPADLLALASVGQSLTMLRELTDDRAALKRALSALDSTAGTGFEQPAAADTSDVSADTDPADLPLDDSEFGIFNNDKRLLAMRVLCQAMSKIEQKKSLLYFSSGMSRNGQDNEVMLRAVTNTCNKANTSIYPVDSRGLTAVAPGGGGRGGGGRGGGGSSMFSGRAMVSAYSSLNASQETLTTLAADTGGQAFIDSNDFGPAFTRMQHDMSAYYLLGYGSTNSLLDGKFRKIKVALKSQANGYRVEARMGYYANSDFAHLARTDKAQQLRDEIAAAVSSTDLPIVAQTTWFRTVPDKGDKAGAARYVVPISVSIPGSAVRVPTAATLDRKNGTIDLLGVITDEQGRKVGQILDTMQIPAAQVATLADKQLQYQSHVTLPAGHFKVKIAARENADGMMGTFEFPISIPDLTGVPLKVSPIVLSTQLKSSRGGGPGGRGGPGGGPGDPGGGRGGDQGGGGRGGRGGFGGGGGFGGPGGPGEFNSQRGGGAVSVADQNPLERNGTEIMQSLSHVVTMGSRMYFYYEVYDPAVDAAGAPKLKTSLAFYRGRAKVFETAVPDHVTIDDVARRAAIFQLQLPVADFKPGLYTCQVNIIDDISGRFVFPRIALYVKEAPKPAGGGK